MPLSSSDILEKPDLEQHEVKEYLAKREKYLKENAMDLGNSLYAQVDSNGKIYYNIMKVDQINIDRVVSDSKAYGCGCRTIVWYHLTREQCNMAGLACLRQEQRAKFEGDSSGIGVIATFLW